MRSRWPFAFGRSPATASRQRSAVRFAAGAAAVLMVVLSVWVAVGIALANGGYEIAWFTVDGGGGESAGGGFTLAGTAGQADAGVLSGGPYTLAGGFWPGAGANFLRFLPIVMR